MRSNRHWIGPFLSPGVYQVSITLFSSCDPFYYALSSFLSPYVICPHPYSSSDQFISHDDIFPFVLADSFFLMTHFISLTILPIVLTLLLAFVLYCCSIYGSHVCGASVTATVFILKLY